MAADDDTQVEGSDLAAIVSNELRLAEAYDRDELNSRRVRAVEYMRGEMTDLPARKHGSQQTSRDFADTVAWILPGVVRVFTASDQMVKYTKVREENDDWSRDASEFMNYSFMNESDGYRILYNATYDGLTQGNGIVSSYWEPERVTTKIFRNRTELELAKEMEEGWQPTTQAVSGKPRYEMIEDPATGEAIEVGMPTFTLKMGKLDRPGKICDITCMPENFRINSTATTIEGARFVAYLHAETSRSDLMEMAEDYGWDTEVIENLPSFRSTQSSEVSDARRRYALDTNSPLKSGDPIDLWECYIRADEDGDGIAELIQCWFAGDPGDGTLLGSEEWEDEVPFTDIPCYPVPHRFQAESVFDRTEDIMRVKTTLLRQGLDNIYAVNMPMREADVGSVQNPDILVNPRFGGIIWKTKGTAPIVPHVVPFVADKAFMALQYMDEMIAKRTGVSRSTMALDPEALQNQTATANQNQRDAGYSQIELIARNMAELGWTRFFKKRLALAIKYQQVRKIPAKQEKAQAAQQQMPMQPGMPQQPMPEDTGFREIDPSKWDPNMAVAINVGLGTGSRDRDMAMLGVIKNGQTMMAQMLGQAGLTAKALEFLPKIRMTAVKEAESSGLKNPEDFYPEITDEEVEQLKQQAAEAAQQPSPQEKIEQAKLAAQAQAEQLKLQASAQIEQQKMMANAEAEKMKAQGNAVKEQAQMQADLQTKEADRQANMALEAQKISSAERIKAAELQFEREKLAVEVQLQRESMANAAQIAASKPKPTDKRPGA